MRLADIDTIKKLAAEHERLNKAIDALANEPIQISIEATYRGSGVKANSTFSIASGVDLARMGQSMHAAFIVERDEIQTKLALYGIEDFRKD